MASNEIDAPTVPQHTAQPAVTGATSPQQPLTTAAATLANRSRRTTDASDKPGWLRQMARPSQLNRRDLARSVSVAPFASGRRHPLENREHTGTSMQLQHLHRPPARQRESEPPPSAPTIVSPPLPPLASRGYPVAGAAKRKAPEAASGDEEHRDWRLRHEGAKAKVTEGGGWTRASGGRTMLISEEEGTRIMMGATMASKNLARGVSAPGGETHGKRARRAAATSDDGEPSLPCPPSPLALHVVLMIARAGQIQTDAFRGRRKLAERRHRSRNQGRLDTRRGSMSTMRWTV